jgi:two-component system alkaline phosphatase synthesis response regulator PhoP
MPTPIAPVHDAIGAPEFTAVTPASRRGTRVLLVEDDPLPAEVFARALARDGHVVDVARDGLQALRRVSEQLPSLIVLDMSLPTVSGADVVRELRRAGHTDVPILVVSGCDRKQTSLDAATLSPGAWLTKPIKPRHLVAMVREWTDRHDDWPPQRQLP